MPLSPEEVGARIVRARDEKKPKPWAQLDLAVALGVSPSSIYRWEKGRLPSMNELIRVAEVLDKPFDYLTEPPERQAELADLERHLESLEVKVDETLGGISDILEILRGSHGESDAGAQGGPP